MLLCGCVLGMTAIGTKTCALVCRFTHGFCLLTIASDLVSHLRTDMN